MKTKQNGVSEMPNTCLGGRCAVAKKLLLAVWMGMLLFGFGKVTLAADSLIATVPTGVGPESIAVNSVTNKIYVANAVGEDAWGNYIWGNTVTVIDGVNNSTATIEVGSYPRAIALNPLTNKIYVSDSNGVTVIDGITNDTTTVATGDSTRQIAVNQATNKIYVVNRYSASVTVIDGATNAAATIPVGGDFTGLLGIAINPDTNKIYVLHSYGPAWAPAYSVRVIDGNTDTVIDNVVIGFLPTTIAVNPVTNQIYVGNGGNLTVIDGSTNATTPITAAANYALVVNPTTNKIYGGNLGGVSVIDGATNATATIITWEKTRSIAVNPATNRIYVLNLGYTAYNPNGNVMVIDGTTNSIITRIEVGLLPYAIVVNPDTGRAYVTNQRSDTVSVIGDLTADTTPPIISSSQSPLANANGWNNTDVTVSFTATDDVSTPACTVDSATLTAEGAGQSVSTTCTDAAGNSASATVSSINIDKTAPMLTLPSLPGSYTVGSSALISFDATDTLSGLASVSATLNGNAISSGSAVALNQLGTNTFTLTATDKAGNSVTQTVHFTVSYDFGGFLPPLTADSRTNFHLGSVIPVKFELFDASGAAISTAVARLSLQKLFNGDPVGDPIDATPTSGADSGNLFRYNGGHYAYNLSTKPDSFTSGIWRIQATLDDGTMRTIDIGLTSK